MIKVCKYAGLFSRILNNDRVGSSPEDISWFKNTAPNPIRIQVMTSYCPDPVDYICSEDVIIRPGFISAPDNFVYFIDPFYRDTFHRSKEQYKVLLSRGEVEMGFYRVCTNKKHNVNWDDLLWGYDETLFMRQSRMGKILVDPRGDYIRAKFINGIDDAPPWLVEYKLGQMFL